MFVTVTGFCESTCNAEDPVKIDLTIDKTNTNFIVSTATISSSSDIYHGRLDIIIPENIQLIRGNEKNIVNLRKDIPVKITFALKDTVQADFKIKCVFYVADEYSKTSVVKYAFFEYLNGKLNFISEDEKKEMLKSGTKENVEINTYNELKSKTTFDNTTSSLIISSDTARIKGSVTFIDSKEKTVPLKYAKTELIAKINDGYKVLNSTYTDETGLFKMDVPINLLATNTNVNVRISTVSSYPVNSEAELNVKLTDPVFRQPYFINSESFVIGDALIAQKNLSIQVLEDENRGASMVFQNCIDASLSSIQQLKINPAPVVAIWPSGNTAANDTIYIMQYDRWDRDVIFHEYAHFLDYNYNLTKRNSGDFYIDEILSQRYDSIFAKGLAYTEGLALFLSVALQYPETKDSYYDDTEDIEIHFNLEGPVKYKGEDCAGAVACILWDIFDANTEDFDNISLGIKSIWFSLSQEKPTSTIRNFVRKYETNNPEEFAGIIPVYKEYTGIKLATGMKILSYDKKNLIDLVCYPNPFKDEITFNYTLHNDGFIQIEIYNIQGNLINTLLSDYQSKAIYHSVKWNGTNLNGYPVSKGMYYVVFKTDNQKITKKIVTIN